MSDRKSTNPRPSFQLRRQDDGEVLVWRNPTANAQVRRQLQAAGIEVGNSLKIGRYCEVGGAVAFIPRATPQAIAALGVDMVQIRICEDLQIRLRGAAAADTDPQDPPEQATPADAGARYALNSAVITGPGDYAYRLIDAAEARRWAAEPFTSTVGYEQTAEALSQLLGMPVPVDRRTVQMAAGDEALVFRLTFPAGTPRIDPRDKGRLAQAVLDGHYELGLLVRRR